MVSRRLHVESLEKRRLFATDLNLITAAECPAQDALLLATSAGESLIASDESSQLESTALLQFVDDSPATFHIAPAVQPTSEVFHGSSIALTEDFALVNRVNFGANTSQLTLIQHASGTASIAKEFKIDFHVQSIHTLHNHFVVMGNPFPARDSLFPSFTFPQRTEIAIIDPLTGDFATINVADELATTRLTLSGQMTDVASFANGLAVTTFPTIIGHASDSESIDDSEVRNSPSSQLGFLAYAESGFTWSSQTIPGTTLIEAADSQLVTVTLQPDNSEDPAQNSTSTTTFIETWQRQEHQLVSISRTTVSTSTNIWDFLRAATSSENGKHLLLNRFHQSLVNEEYWDSEIALDVFRLDEMGASLQEQVKIPSSSPVDTRFVNNQLVLLLDSQPEDSIRVLDLAGPDSTVMHTLPLTQPLQFQNHLLLGDRYLALFGHTASLPIEEVITVDDTQTITTTTYTNRSGAIVVVDLLDWKISDEEIMPENVIIDNPYRTRDAQNKFSWRSMIIGEDGYYIESRDLGQVIPSGSLELLDRVPWNANWSESTSDGNHLYNLTHDELSQRELDDPSVVNWTIPLQPLPEIIICEPFPEVTNGWEIETTNRETNSLSPLHSSNRIDIDNDGIISPIDVLYLINHINRSIYNDDNTSPSVDSAELMPRLDIDGDTHVLPSDAIALITFFNQSYTELETSSHTLTGEPNGVDYHFWDRINSLPTVDFSKVDEAMELMFIEPEVMLSFCEDDNWWHWFAAVDPIAKRITDVLLELEIPETPFDDVSLVNT